MPREAGPRESRTWGFWTEQKLSMLADYLRAFTIASKKSPRTLYLDLFAGQDRNLSRTTGEPISGSPRVALDTKPPFTKIILFELPEKTGALELELRKDYPDRDFEVIPGDCNETLGPVLRNLIRQGWNRTPTFALVDQQAAEVRWETLEKLSKFKRPEHSKAELWLLFAPSMLPRGLVNVDPAAVERFAERITAMYGTEEWRDAYTARMRGILAPGELRTYLLDLMRWRLEKVLGYRVTHSFEMKNTVNVPIYNLVFATDHPAGETIMNDIYKKAAEAQPVMREDARAILLAKKEEKTGIRGLFAPPPRAVRTKNLYQHEPPGPPYRLPPDA